MLAHRISWLLTYGDLPLLFMCHKCDERYTVGDTTYRKCVNPAHLFPGTNSDNIQDMYNKGRGRTRSAVGEAHGMTTLTDEQVLELRAAYLSGTRQKELAARYGLWPGTIAHIVQGYTWGHLPNSPLTPSEARRGERNGKAVLTEDDVRSVRVRVAAAESPASIAREYGVKQPAIGKIVARRTWKHVA